MPRAEINAALDAIDVLYATTIPAAEAALQAAKDEAAALRVKVQAELVSYPNAPAEATA